MTFSLIFWDGKSYDIETLCIDRVLNKKHFFGKIIQKMYNKSFTNFNFSKWTKTTIACKKFWNKIFWKRIIKNRKKRELYFFFRTQSLLLGKIMKV